MANDQMHFEISVKLLLTFLANPFERRGRKASGLPFLLAGITIAGLHTA